MTSPVYFCFSVKKRNKKKKKNIPCWDGSQNNVSKLFAFPIGERIRWQNFFLSRIKFLSASPLPLYFSKCRSLLFKDVLGFVGMICIIQRKWQSEFVLISLQLENMVLVISHGICNANIGFYFRLRNLKTITCIACGWLEHNRHNDIHQPFRMERRENIA